MIHDMHIEALLFTAGEPLRLASIASALDIGVEEAQSAVLNLQERYETDHRGLRILLHDDRVQLVTAPESSEVIARHMKERLREDISPAASETLAIVAYRGPIARAGIEAIRGVNASFTLRLLTMRGLVEKVKNPDNSRVPLYHITEQFLSHLGMSCVEDLPDYEALSHDARVAAVEEEHE
jgi:segregation and condensation protein B